MVDEHGIHLFRVRTEAPEVAEAKHRIDVLLTGLVQHGTQCLVIAVNAAKHEHALERPLDRSRVVRGSHPALSLAGPLVLVERATGACGRLLERVQFNDAVAPRRATTVVGERAVLAAHVLQLAPWT